MNSTESRKILIQETGKLLDSIRLALMDIEENGASMKNLNQIFIAVYTIKRSSGLFGFDLVSNIAHQMENLLLSIKNKKINVDMSITCLFSSCEAYLKEIINTLDETGELIDPDPVLQQSLLYQLNYYINQPMFNSHELSSL